MDTVTALQVKWSWLLEHPLILAMLGGIAYEMATRKSLSYFRNHHVSVVITLVFLFYLFVFGASLDQHGQYTVATDPIKILWNEVLGTPVSEILSINRLGTPEDMMLAGAMIGIALYAAIHVTASIASGDSFNPVAIFSLLIVPFVFVVTLLAVIIAMLTIGLVWVLFWGIFLNIYALTTDHNHHPTLVGSRVGLATFFIFALPFLYSVTGIFQFSGKGIFVFNVFILIEKAFQYHFHLNTESFKAVLDALSAGVLSLVDPDGSLKVLCIVAMTIVSLWDSIGKRIGNFLHLKPPI